LVRYTARGDPDEGFEYARSLQSVADGDQTLGALRMVGVAGQVLEIDVIEEQSRLPSRSRLHLKRHECSQHQQQNRYQETVTLNLKTEWYSPSTSRLSFARKTGPDDPAGPPTCCPSRKEPRVLPLSEMPIRPSYSINERWLL